MSVNTAELEKQQYAQANQKTSNVSSEQQAADYQRYMFYSQLGHPELATKYSAFEIPPGYSVTSLTETEKGLQVGFTSTAGIQQQQESQAFYTALGYPQFGGKYAPFANPENRPVKTITEIPDNPQTPESEAGLKVEFGMTPEEQYKFNQSSLFWKYAGYPEYAGKYAPVPNPEKRPIKSVTEIQDNPLTPENEAGLKVEFGMTPEEQYAFNTSSLFWKYAGFPQYAGKYGPVPNPEHRPIASVEEIADNPLTPESEAGLKVTFGRTAAEQQAYDKSVAFYTEIGFPQFGGRYDPFTIPEGQRVSSIEETSQGLIVRYPTGEESISASHFGPTSPTLPPMYIAPTSATVPSQSYPELHIVGLHGAVVSDIGIPTTLSPLAQAQVAAMIATPEGMELVKVEPTFVQTPADIGREDVAGKAAFVAEYTPKTFETPYNLFGITEYELNPKTQELVQLVPTKQGETLKLSMGELSTDINAEPIQGQPNPAEQMSALGISLATVVAGAVSPQMFGTVTFGNATSHMTLPVSGVASFVGVGLAETYKYGTTGQHLTLPEAIGVAGLSQIAVGAYMTFQPRIQAMLKTSGYGESLQARINQEYAASQESGQLWQPTLSERIGMKLTGEAPTVHLATGTVPITKNVPESTMSDYQAAQIAKESARADMVRGFDAKEMVGTSRDLTEQDWIAREIGAVSNQPPKSLYDYPSLNRPPQQPTTMSPYNPNEPFTGNLQTLYTQEAEWDIMGSFGSQGIMPQEYVSRGLLPKAYGGGGGSSFTTVGIGAGRASLILTQSIGLSNSPAVDLQIAQKFLSQARQVTHLQYGTSFYEGSFGVSALTVQQQIPKTTETKVTHFTPVTSQAYQTRQAQRQYYVNPFLAYQGETYYPTQTVTEEEMETYISYPRVLPTPAQASYGTQLTFTQQTPITIKSPTVQPMPTPQQTITIPKPINVPQPQTTTLVSGLTNTSAFNYAIGLSNAQIQQSTQVQKQTQSQTTAQLLKQLQQSKLVPAFPYLSRSMAPFIPASGIGNLADTEPRGKKKKGYKQDYGKFLWEFPVMGPEKIMKRDFMGKRKK